MGMGILASRLDREYAKERESGKEKTRNNETQHGLGRQDKRAAKAPKDLCSNPSQATEVLCDLRLVTDFLSFFNSSFDFIKAVKP